MGRFQGGRGQEEETDPTTTRTNPTIILVKQERDYKTTSIHWANKQQNMTQ